jgi:hypothetical protein
MKTSELSGAALNWAVAKCADVINGDALDVGFIREGGYTPSTDWAQGGAIIEREKISLIWMQFTDEQYWLASIDAVRREHEMFNGIELPYEHEARGTTPLEAAMRCYVTSKLGNEVQIPEGI